MAALPPDEAVGSRVGKEKRRLHVCKRRFGPSVIIGLGKIQSYQWFASSKQEVFI